MSDLTARIEELEEMKQEYILNEAVTADDHPSWGELAEAQAIAESAWNETSKGQELKDLLTLKAALQQGILYIPAKKTTGE